MVQVNSIRFGGIGAFYDGSPPRIFTSMQTYTDVAGRFEFKRVPPIPLALMCGESQPYATYYPTSPNQPTPANSEQAASGDADIYEYYGQRGYGR